MSAFNTERRLRSSEFHAAHLYALYRMCNLLDDPPRTAVKAALRSCLTFRNLAVPKFGKPLTIPMLANTDFSKSVRRWIQSLIHQYKDYLIPFHLPSKTVIAGTFPSFRSVLYNNIILQQQWDWDHPPVCHCEQWKQQHPQLRVVDGHVASPAHLLAVSRRIQNILQHSADSQVYPKRQFYIDHTWKAVQQWLRHYGLFDVTKDNWAAFVQSQWNDHSLESRDALKFKDVTFLRKIPDGFFIHGRDHAVAHVHVFCPLFVWRVYRKTFGDPEVYERLPLTYSQASVFLKMTTRKALLTRYKWGFRASEPSIPIAYILLKQKKSFQAARPIISYKYFLYARLFKATAIVIDLLVRDVCPDSFGLDTLPVMLQKLSAFLHQAPEDFEALSFNQDLVGFFTSIPVDRILQSIDAIISRYCYRHALQLADVVFSVLLKEKDVNLRIWRGRPRKAAQRPYLIHLQDVRAICHLSCECSVFSVMQCIFRQRRGATIGNQISPMLANATVSLEEQRFVELHRADLQRIGADLFCTRYVDNRLVILDVKHEHRAFLKQFLSNDFYARPVELEHVHSQDAEQEFLGFDVIPQQSKILLLLRDEPWKIRLHNSAGSSSQKLASYHSKRHSILRHVQPPEMRVQQLEQLKQLFLQAGFSRASLGDS